MNNNKKVVKRFGDFSDIFLNKSEQDEYNSETRNITEIKGEKTGYEVTSLSHSFSTRHQFPELTEEESYLLAFYGKYGLTVNTISRRTDDIIHTPDYENYDQVIQSSRVNLQLFRKRSKRFNTIENFVGPFTDKNKFSPDYDQRLNDFISKNLKISRRQLPTGGVRKKSHMTYSIASLTNDMIFKRNDDFDDSDFLYRISRAKKNLYASTDIASTQKYPLLPSTSDQPSPEAQPDHLSKTTLDEKRHRFEDLPLSTSAEESLLAITAARAPEPEPDESLIGAVGGAPLPASSINIGDVVADKAFLSTSLDPNAVIHRYSHKSTSMQGYTSARSASNKEPLAPDEEEILYVIKNNEHLKSMGISGFKFGQRHERDDKSSGEVLVSPTARYRVVGIQNNESARDRRVVFLHPTPASEISPGEIQKNLFNGEAL